MEKKDIYEQARREASFFITPGREDIWETYIWLEPKFCLENLKLIKELVEIVSKDIDIEYIYQLNLFKYKQITMNQYSKLNTAEKNKLAHLYSRYYRAIYHNNSIALSIRGRHHDCSLCSVEPFTDVMHDIISYKKSKMKMKTKANFQLIKDKIN